MKYLRILIVVALILAAFASLPSDVKAQKFSSYVSSIQVQNMGTSEIDSLQLNFIDRVTGNSVAVVQGVDKANPNLQPIPVDGTRDFYPLPINPPPFDGSVVLSSDQPVAAISNLQNADGSARASYVGSSSGSTTLYLPSLMHGNGYNPNDTWISVQNAGDADATLSIAYNDCTTNPTLPTLHPGQSLKIDNSIETCHTQKIFSGIITSSQPLVGVVVQEKNPPSPNPSGLSGVMYAYTAFTSDGSLLPVAPAVFFNNSNNQVALLVQNTGTGSTDITFTYTPYTTGGAGTACTETQTVAGKGSAIFGMNAFAATAPGGYTGTTNCVRGQRFLGSASVTSNSGSQNLNVVVNQTKYGTSRAGAYDAFNPAKAGPKVYMPKIFDRRGIPAKLYTAFFVMNVGTIPANVKCTFTNTAVTYTGTIPANQAALVSQENAIAANYVGAGVCQTYTDTSYNTVDLSGKILTVVNQVTGYKITDTAQLSTYYSDTLMIYEGINP